MAKPNLTGKDAEALANHPLGQIIFLRRGAYCNLNDIAKLSGKRVDNWMRLKGTKELLQAFRDDPAYGGAEPIRTVVGRSTEKSAHSDLSEHSKPLVQQGTFAHPHIAIAFAQWCSPVFQLWVSRQIEHLLEHGEVNLHHAEWTIDQHVAGRQLNRDDIHDLYGR